MRYIKLRGVQKARNLKNIYSKIRCIFLLKIKVLFTDFTNAIFNITSLDITKDFSNFLHTHSNFIITSYLVSKKQVWRFLTSKFNLHFWDFLLRKPSKMYKYRFGSYRYCRINETLWSLLQCTFSRIRHLLIIIIYCTYVY